MTRRAEIHRISMSGPSDVSGIESLIASGLIKAGQIRAILGKTEGNGCVNDFTRGYATQSLRAMLSCHLSGGEIDRLPMVMSGGTEGGLSPHWILFCETESGTDSGPALAFASAITRDLKPSEIGRQTQAELTCDAVLDAMKLADISRPEDVHFVQVKCPLLTSERVAEADGDVSTSSMLRSMGLSRGASALGVALALGEIDQIPQNSIGNDHDLWSSRASCSSGIELMACEIVVIGQSASWSGPLRAAHGVMTDAIDATSVANLLAQVTPSRIIQGGPEKMLAVLAKAEASSNGSIRNSRHTMNEDSDLSATRHARAFVGGLLAGMVGHTELFVSGGAEHQGPDGGGPVAIIYSTT